MQPLLSVVIPLYNSEKYIEKCLESILNSTYKNLQIVVVDDGSVDKGAEIVRAISERDNRVILCCQKNMGVSVARNNGIKVAGGDYITFIDADDYIEKNTFSIVMNALLESDSDAAIYAMIREHDITMLYESLPWEDRTVLNKDRIENELIPLTLEAKKNQTWVSGSVWRLVFKKEKLTTKFDENVRYREDQQFCIASYAGLSNIIVCNQAKYHYVKHSVTTTESYRNGFFKESIECEEKIITILKDKHLFEKVFDHYKIQRLSTYSLCISNLFRHNAPINTDNELKYILDSFKNDKYMKWSISEILELTNKYKVVLCLLKINNAKLICKIYRRKENVRQKKIAR